MMERRLAAILLTDIVGYSRLMGLDEQGTLARQKAHRAEIIDPKIFDYGGRIVKSTGDGLLVEFHSVVDAVQCAVEVQEVIARCDRGVPEDQRIRYRIGINVGDIFIDGDDILGDGVNVAARLEALAKPGGVCISSTVHDHLAGKMDVTFEDAGEQTVKNVPRPVRVWQWQVDQTARTSHGIDAPLLLPNRPSIAVLPFDNVSDDPEQEFLADGMTEDIISNLSKFHWLLVIASRSAFVYKDQSKDVREIAKELGVRYVLEGRIRRAGQRLRIMAKLADAETGKHLWSERYDPELEDIFAIQDEVADAIVREIAPEIGQVEVIRAQRKPPENLDAWGLYQRGLARYPSGAKEDFEAAIVAFDQAVDLDPLFADAKAMAALTRLRLIYYFRPHNSDVLIERARDLALGAMRLDPRNATCHSAMGRLHNISEEYDEALAACRQAVNLNPNSVVARSELASALASLENWSEAIDHFDFMQKLSPMDPHISASFAGRAICLFRLGRYEESVEFGLKASRSPNPRYWADAALVASLTLLGRNEEAMKAKKTLLDRKPDFSIAAHARMQGAHVSDIMINALRQAGLPE